MKERGQMRLLPGEMALLFLERDEELMADAGSQMSPERAKEMLVILTGQDWGYDVEKWRACLWETGHISERFAHSRAAVQPNRSLKVPRMSALRLWVTCLGGHDPRGNPLPQETQDKFLRLLRAETGQDFGGDAHKWEEWITVNRAGDYY
jgi:hypothetical protein